MSVILDSNIHLFDRMRTAKYSLNESYFDRIDDSKKAYWLGFIAADGYIHKITEGKLRLVIELSSKDESILKSFLEDIGSNHPIQKRTSITAYGDETCFISITRFNFVQPLIQIGVKTEGIFENIPEHLKLHFIRGLFDGDGCLHLETYNPAVCGFNAKQYRWILASQSEKLLLAIQQNLICNCKVNMTKLIFQKVWKLQYNGNTQVARIDEYLYPPGTICLVQRKHIPFSLV